MVIATRNRAPSLRRTLQQLRLQRPPVDSWEVVVVDNGSTDGTGDVLAEAAAYLPLNRRNCPIVGLNRARNCAVAVARGEFVVCTDDDVAPHEGWLAEFLAAAKRWPSVNIFGGRIVPVFPPDTPTWMSGARRADMLFARLAYGSEEALFPDWHWPYGPNFAMRGTLYRKCHFAEDLGPQDGSFPMGSETELFLRLGGAGERTVYVPNAIVEHFIRPEQVTLRAIYARSLRCGRGLARTMNRPPGRAVFGVPVSLLRRGALHGFLHLARKFCHPCHRLNAGVEFYITVGRICEYPHLVRLGLEPGYTIGPVSTSVGEGS